MAATMARMLSSLEKWDFLTIAGTPGGWVGLRTELAVTVAR
jgi:hypothetical protein